MGKMKIRLKTILIIFGAIIALPLLGYIGLCVKAFYLNMNPDHVDLQKGGWVKLMHFTTDTRTDKRKTLVEIYGKSAKEPNSGNFIIVRQGLLPLGILAVSPIYHVKHLWEKEYEYNNEHGDSIVDSIQVFGLSMGYEFPDRIFKYRYAPSLQVIFYCKYNLHTYVLSGLHYLNCDKIPFEKIFQRKYYDLIFSEKRSGVCIDCDFKYYLPYKEEKWN
jgi:hypothetical protein